VAGAGSDLGRGVAHLRDPVLVDGEEEYEVEVVINSRMFRGRLQYLSFNGRATAMNTTVGRMLRMYTPQSLVTEFYSTHPELHAKYVELIWLHIFPIHSRPSCRVVTP